ncbi:copper chaperone PCu(A)C [Neptunomonas marina]|uniref:Copper chaperone PCu(A)C n=1 Tax=Neptunomonas marina TaxID=1815562 RepID=A0A437Q9A1_9GAMM|nr:copper chaperone PCu(A)C [Neptunomonas marina]RVU31128.1 copper chaperone PCu(A)C [Neptunomonas marina]
MKKVLFATLLSAASLSHADVVVENPYARAVPPGQMNSAAFMMLKNTDSTPVALIAAKSDVAKSVELHNHINEEGVMRMRQVKEITIPANGMTNLQPGGYHVMFIGLNRDLPEGKSVDVTLQFSDNSSQTVTLPVKKVMAGMKHHQHKH